MADGSKGVCVVSEAPVVVTAAQVSIKRKCELQKLGLEDMDWRIEIEEKRRPLKWKEGQVDDFGWMQDDVITLPGVPGKIHMAMLQRHLVLVTLFGMALVGIALAFFCVPFWIPEAQKRRFALVGGALVLGRAVVFVALAVFLFAVEGEEVWLAVCGAWLEVVVGGLLLVVHFIPHPFALVLPVGLWLIFRGLWFELLGTCSSWKELTEGHYGREWWLVAVTAWIPAMLGGLLLARIPSGDVPYLAMLLGSCTLSDGLSLWVTTMTLKFRLEFGTGLLADYARKDIKVAVGQGFFVQGVLRLTPLFALFAANGLRF
eukprot:jgi/Mesen1/6678/ME000343S05855